MKLLLDTHTLLWYTINDPQLSEQAESMILDVANEIYISPATYWEMAIKISINKLSIAQPFENFLNACEQLYLFQLLPITSVHVLKVSSLPFPKQHRDPFDRMIVAQSIIEQMPVVSNDIALDAYPINRIW